MIELFPNISEDLRQQAAVYWNLIQTQAPEVAVNLMKAYINFNHTDEEQEFLNFFFNVQMEKLNNE